MKVAGFGMTITDVLMTTDSITLQTKNPVSHQSIQVGGVVSSALMVLARLGVDTTFYSMVGNDMFGDTLLMKLRKEHVGVAHVYQAKDINTPLACVILHNNDQRTIFYTADSFASWKHPGYGKTLATDVSYVLLDGHNVALTREFLDNAKEHNIKSILDLGNPKKGLEELIPRSWGIIIPQAFWKVVHTQRPEEIVKHYLTLGPELVILTMGEEGSLIGTKEKVFHQNSWPVRAIDTNGAGDVFFGSFVYGLLQNWPITKVAEFASASAARSTTIVGKQQKIPHSEAEVFEFLTAQRVTNPAKIS